MNIVNLKQKRGEAGFTLVELAIVMIIIGLLIGGVLKGQELIKNAQVSATITQIEGFDGALSTFKDKYGAMPGDMLTPSTRLRNCTAAPCSTAGNANGRIEGSNAAQPIGAPALATEGLVAFPQLAAADLISGVSITGGTVTFGSYLPDAKVGGGYWIGYSTTADLGAGMTAGRIGHYLILTGTPAAVAAATATGITATQAAQIDRKLDDENAVSGDVLATGNNCQALGVYNESSPASTCSMAIRIQS